MFTIRVMHFFKEKVIGEFNTLKKAQKVLIKSGYKKQGESELFWEMSVEFCTSKYLAEITKLPKPCNIKFLPKKEKNDHKKWCSKSPSAS